MNKSAFFYFSIYKNLIKTMFQLMRGIWRIGHLQGPIVSIFGGSRLQMKSPYAETAHDLASLLIQHDISVITGGGPGIMEAANCGATHAETEKTTARSIGITVKGLEQEAFNMCAQEKIIVDYFFVRKWLMIEYSVAFAFFPGGFGTLDEFGEVVTLMQTKKLAGVPVVLIGKSFWGPYMQWLHDYPLKEGLIVKKDLDLIKVVDNVDEALQLLKEHCDICK
jgi:uncharacterized protein (TIGR00730 family)